MAALLALVPVVPAGAEAMHQTTGPATSSSFTLYASSRQHAYVNMADDRSRGEGTNPFGNYSGAVVPQSSNEKLAGPFPGDEGAFAFTLYKDPRHRVGAGTATVLCFYNFGMSALCDAAFQLDQGELLAKGPASFNDAALTLDIVGGTHGFRGVKGQVDAIALGIATQVQPVFRAAPLLQWQRLTFTVRRTP